MTTRSVLLLALMAGLSPGGARAGSIPPNRPNVLVILADDMGYSDAGCYGGEIGTPHLDALAAGGLRFTQFYNTARCWPSRAALLTGHYAQAVRRDALPDAPRRGQGRRPDWAPLLPELLKPLGYRSYLSGKWHVDGKPLEGGFDRSYTLEDHNRYFTPRNHAEDDKNLAVIAPDRGYYATTAIADHAIKCLQEHAENYAGQPFFQYVAFTAPHFPLHAIEEDIDRYRNRYRDGWNAVQAERGRRLQELGIASHAPPAMERDLGPPYDYSKDLGVIGPGEVQRPVPWTELSDAQRELQSTKMAIHAAMVDRMDREIGRIIAQLKAIGALENTLVVFASDNGASAELMVRGDGHDPDAPPGSAATFLCLGPGWSSASNTPFRRHKTWVHEGGIATPFIAHWPRGIAARGELRHNPAHLIDIVPTVLEIAGARHPEVWNSRPVPTPPGKSLVPVFSEDGAVAHDDLWWLHDGHRAIRMKDWKLVSAGPRGSWELYDLSRDRGESRDLAATHPEKVRELEARWNQRLDECRKLAAEDNPKSSRDSRGPNIVFFLADDLGWSDLGCYGSTFYETPRLNRLASDGARFTQAYAACPVCSPTRASILTGKWPQRCGVTDYIGAPAPEKWTRNTKLLPADYVNRLALDEITLAEALKERGYATFFAGKWHLGPEGFWPENQGFDINRGGIDRGGPYGGNKYFSPYGNPRLDDGPPGEHLPDRLATETAKFMEANKDRPFLAYLSFYSVHTPLMAREDLRQKYETKRQKLGIEVRWGREEFRDVRLVQEHAVYAGMVEALDLAVGKVLDKLDELGLRDNTIVLFTSDNGGLSTSEGWPTSNLPLRAGKGWLYEGGIREPLIVRWPGVARAGTTVDSPVTSPDFYPTLLEAAGVRPPASVDGISFAPLLKGQNPPNDRSLFWHYPHYGNQGGAPGAAIRRGDWKLIEWFEDDRVELFHLTQDIAETTDHSAREPNRVKRMRHELDAWQQDVGAKFPAANPAYDGSKPNGRAAKRTAS